MPSPSSSDASFIAYVTNTASQLNRYFGILIILFGLLGNIANILVLSQRALRSNPCAWLFLVSSIANAIGLFTSISTRVFSTWAIDLTTTNPFLCKLRAFIAFDSTTVGFWLIALATVDRWLLSSINVNRRHRSTLKAVQRCTILIVVLSTVIQAPIPYCFEANLTNTALKCDLKTQLCGLIADLSFALITILFPLLVMVTFGLMTISNIRQVQSRLRPLNVTMAGTITHKVLPVATGQQYQRKKIDRQLLIMLCVQVVLIILFTLPLAMMRLYLRITTHIPKAALQRTTETFIFNLFLLFYYMTCGMPFYINTLSGGRVFRKALFSMVRMFCQRIMCRRVRLFWAK